MIKSKIFRRLFYNDSILVDFDSDWMNNEFIRVIATLFILLFVSIIALPAFPIVLIMLIIEKLILFIFYKLFAKNGKKWILKDLLKYEKSVIHDYPTYLQLGGYGTRGYVHSSDLLFGEFIKLLILDFNNNYPTCLRNGNYQCYSGRRRSLGDIYLICKNYYPKCTIEEVLSELITLADNREISASYCNTINKFVFHVESGFFDRKGKLEWSKNFNSGDLITHFKK